MKLLLIIIAFIMPFAVLANDDTITIENDTWCLLNMNTLSQVTYTKPVTVYTFKPGSTTRFIYDNTSVPAGHNGPIKMYPNSYVSVPAAFLGTRADDTAAHITTNVPGNQRIVIQEYGRGACTQSQPCVGFIPSQVPVSQCSALLKKH